MDVSVFIGSGALENYCMGFCSNEERAMVEKYAAQYPEVARELEKTRDIFEEYLLANTIEPSPGVKFSIMESVYRQQALENTGYLPLVKKDNAPLLLKDWVSKNQIPEPVGEFDNLFLHELPSTPFVTNFIVWAKEGHDTEEHVNFVEYLYILKGSCTMYYGDTSVDYQAGEIIHIPPHIPHKAVVTSTVPMIAIVQRQACA